MLPVRVSCPCLMTCQETTRLSKTNTSTFTNKRIAGNDFEEQKENLTMTNEFSELFDEIQSWDGSPGGTNEDAAKRAATAIGLRLLCHKAQSENGIDINFEFNSDDPSNGGNADHFGTQVSRIMHVIKSI